jgi:hypothetical protein
MQNIGGRPSEHDRSIAGDRDELHLREVRRSDISVPGVHTANDVAEDDPDDGLDLDQQSTADDDDDRSDDDAMNKSCGENVPPTKRGRAQSSQVRNSKLADIAMSQVFEFTPVTKKAKSLPSPSPGEGVRSVRERMSGAIRIASAIEQLSTSVAPTVHERAISVLTENYCNCLTDMQMVQAYSLMTDKAKAAIFVAMPANRCRKLWLFNEIGAEMSQI